MDSIATNREDGGRLVREAWIAWAKKQSNPKASWLVPWDALDDASKEASQVIWDHIVGPYVKEYASLAVAHNRRLDELNRVQAEMVNWRERHNALSTLYQNALSLGEEQ